MIEDAMILIKKRPWLGYGLNSFRYMDARELYSHNNYVELLFSGGIPMLAVYYLMHLWMLIKSLKLMFIKNKPAMDVAVFCVLVMMLVNDIGMVSYYSKYFITLQMFMFVYIEARTKAEKAKKLALKEESEGAHEKEDMLLHT